MNRFNSIHEFIDAKFTWQTCTFPYRRRLYRTSIRLSIILNTGLFQYDPLITQTHTHISYMHKIGKFIQIAVITAIWSQQWPTDRWPTKQRYFQRQFYRWLLMTIDDLRCMWFDTITSIHLHISGLGECKIYGKSMMFWLRNDLKRILDVFVV